MQDAIVLGEYYCIMHYCIALSKLVFPLYTGLAHYGTRIEKRILMKEKITTAIPIWRGRVSPVMDTAEQLLIVEMNGGIEIGRRQVYLGMTDHTRRAAEICDLGIDVLLCGAVSRALEASLVASGIEMVSQLCGDIECVLKAFVDGKDDLGAFNMPGLSWRKGKEWCCGRGDRRRRRRHGN